MSTESSWNSLSERNLYPVRLSASRHRQLQHLLAFVQTLGTNDAQGQPSRVRILRKGVPADPDEFGALPEVAGWRGMESRRLSGFIFAFSTEILASISSRLRRRVVRTFGGGKGSTILINLFEISEFVKESSESPLGRLTGSRGH